MSLQPFFWNGTQYWVEPSPTLLELFSYFNYPRSLLVVEYNGALSDPPEWATRGVNPNDRIEVVTLVGGG